MKKYYLQNIDDHQEGQRKRGVRNQMNLLHEAQIVVVDVVVRVTIDTPTIFFKGDLNTIFFDTYHEPMMLARSFNFH